MWLGFFDADELRARHAQFRERSRVEHAEATQALDNALRAVSASWTTLARSKALVESADRFRREREIQNLADELLAAEQRLLETNDDGAILATIFPRRDLPTPPAQRALAATSGARC
jgi:hypothetical protein